MKVSILLTSYKRANLLKYGLLSLSHQAYKHDVEIIVLNDGDANDETKSVCNSFNVNYIYTGGHSGWRVPGYALNIGIKKAKGDIIFLSCAEMYHMDDTINMLCDAITPYNRVICDGRDDLTGDFLRKVDDVVDMNDYASCGNLNVHYPFFMCVYRSNLIEIGGYDEDFVGLSYDDDDLIGRLQDKGITEEKVTDAHVVHLYHPRTQAHYGCEEFNARLNHNKQLYEQRRGTIKRNINREWGVIKCGN